ncbi:MAG TPA: hypothetical protein VFZ61_14555 [Polyangiales bacterium]
MPADRPDPPASPVTSPAAAIVPPPEVAPSTPKNWDEVDEASWESFPASDPPASWAGKDREPVEEDSKD